MKIIIHLHKASVSIEVGQTWGWSVGWWGYKRQFHIFRKVAVCGWRMIL